MTPKTNCAPGVITLFLPAKENALLRDELSKGMSASVGHILLKNSKKMGGSFSAKNQCKLNSF